MTDFTIVIPVFNESKNIKLLVDRINNLKMNKNFNILFINDGSTDDTWNTIKSLNKKDNKIKGISFSRNFGHQIALSAGIDNVEGKFLIMMDGDLQHPPEKIPTMIKKYEEGYDVVQLVKSNQGKRNFIQKIFSYFFYMIFRKISGVPLSNNVSDFRLISEKVISQIKKF